MSKVNVANALTVGRMAAVPFLLAASWYGRPNVFFALAAYCMLSDIFDGRIARWLGQSSEFGARLDSWADVMMILCGPVCAAWLRPELIRSESMAVSAVVGGNILAIVIGYAKFGRLTCYHTIAARLTAYIAGAGAIIAITWGWPWLFRLGAAIAVYSVLEEIAITFTLKAWTANVSSLKRAITMEAWSRGDKR